MTEALRPHSPECEGLAARWRARQLEISWLLSLMDRYEDFDRVTAHALDFALAEASESLGEAERRDVLARLDLLDLHEDARPALEALANAGFTLAVLSNGTPRALDALLRRAGIRDRFEVVVSADEVRVYKPAARVYRHAAERLRRPIGDVWLVSANPFDLAGAKAAGMRPAAVERVRRPRYAFAPPPDLAAPSLVDLARDFAAT